MKRGENLEDFVQYVYTRLLQLNDFEDIPVQKHTKVLGMSGAYNEFDVLYEFKHLNIQCRVVIECKDWKKPVPIGAVRDFCEKIKDIGQGQTIGLMVSRNGYQQGAVQFAKANGITLLRTGDLPGISKITAGILQKGFLPNESSVGDPFWTIMKIKNGNVTGEYLSIGKSLGERRPTIPLFYSPKLAEPIRSIYIDKDEYCVRGISQYQLRILLALKPFGNPQFAVYYLPFFDENPPFVIMDAEALKKIYLR